jgi:hypothetical protein
MPSTSAKQKRFMAAVAHNPKFADEVDVPQSVGQEFFEADQAKTSRTGKRRGKIAKAIAKVREG